MPNLPRLLPRPTARNRGTDPSQPCGDADQHRLSRRETGPIPADRHLFSPSATSSSRWRGILFPPKSMFTCCWISCAPGTGPARWCSIAGRASVAPPRQPLSPLACCRPTETRPRSRHALRRASPTATPNARFVALADDLLGRRDGWCRPSRRSAAEPTAWKARRSR